MSSSSTSSRLSSLFGPSSRAHTLIQQHPRATKSDGSFIKYDYGTSGFRGLATTLDSVTLRFGMLMVLRALSMGKTSIPTPLVSTQKETITSARTPVVGLMITASHNEEKDNGLKAIDPSGEMLATSWESIATALANESEANAATFLCKLSEQHNLDWSITPRLFIGRDTRTSSPHLAALVVAGIQALGGQVVDFGLLTTPQLHWIVHEFNLGRQASLELYYKTISRSFMTLLQKEDGSHRQLEPLILDCANGVGGSACHVLASTIEKVLKLEIRNDKNSGLNDRVGAEHVQKTRTLPLGYDKSKEKGKKMASIDGDADRLVYYYVNTKGDVRLLDGDKIIALYTLFLRDLIHATNLNLSMGIVQTAYANGASTIYMQEELKVPVQCTPTGVKHLHHKALEYDVGVYFESNGHGTVIVNSKTIEQLKQVASTSGPAATAATRLLAVVDMVNQCVGDAISDLLLVEVALAERGWSLADWDALYEDLPSSMLKVYVADRSIIQTTDAERRCTAPIGLQEAIDRCIASGKGTAVENSKRRAFVRPSGTEDVVRVYAEANTRQEVDELAQQVCDAVFQLAGGIKK